MTREKRRSARRKSDRLILETMRFHRAILDLLQGKGGDVEEILRGLKELSPTMGRRVGDKELGEEFSRSLEGITNRLMELGVIERLPRKVLLRKVLGKSDGGFPIGLERTGWEMELPKHGERYCLYLDNGNVFRTGLVEECGVDHFRTGNSIYAIEVLEGNMRLQQKE
jgi:hypothetical protein